MTSQGQGPLNDPRLVERRGDLSGLNAVLFIGVIVAVFVVAGLLLAGVLKFGGSSATPTPTVRPSPTATARASTSPTPGVTPSASPMSTVAVGDSVKLVVGGLEVGTVSVAATDFPNRVKDRVPQEGKRWLVARITLEATTSFAYDAKDWSAVDAEGNSIKLANVARNPELGSGTLKAGRSEAGFIAFQVPQTGSVFIVFNGNGGPFRVSVPAQ